MANQNQTNNNANNNNNNNGGSKSYKMKDYSSKTDPLGFNAAGMALVAGVFSVPYEQALKRLDDVAKFYLGDVTAKIEYWVDNDSSSYDTESKRHSASNRVSFQVWMKKDNPNLTKNSDGNDFIDAVISYSEDLKTFIRTFGVDNDQNIRALLNKRGNAYVILVDPSKLFAAMFDMTGNAYKDATSNQLDRPVEIRTECLWDNEDPIKVLRNFKDRRRREKPELTGFLVIKTYAKLGSFSNGTFRPPLNTHKNRERDEDNNEFRKKFKSI